MSRQKIPDYQRGQVVQNQNTACNYCGERLKITTDGIPLFDIDHIIMHSVTQDNTTENLQALCLPCHRIKSVREIRTSRKKYKNIASVQSKEIVSLTNKINPFEKFKFEKSITIVNDKF